MKQEYRQTKRPVIEQELYDNERPQKKRGGKRKVYGVFTVNERSVFMRDGFCLGRYDTLARAEQGLKALSHTWGKCVIKKL